jgi:hypothetical protein
MNIENISTREAMGYGLWAVATGAAAPEYSIKSSEHSLNSQYLLRELFLDGAFQESYVSR